MSATAPKARRIAGIDIARGVALVCMAIYHFVWDLTFFGYLEPAVATTGPMRWFARAIASSFLFLVGISLVLAHAKAIRWQSFWRRWIAVAACAGVISLATWFATPQTFVYFGILHHIALASLLGLLFLGLPWPVLVALSASMFVIAQIAATAIFNEGWLLWTGLNTSVRASNDYVPLLPWFGAVLFGMAFAKSPLLDRVFHGDAAVSGLVPRSLSWMGQRSLIVYMVHQPILIAMIYLATLVAPPMVEEELAFPPDPFLDACETTCMQSGSADFCIAYCACVDVRLQQRDLKDALIEGSLAVDDQQVVSITQQCTADIGDALIELREQTP
ncbi:MAG: heparan-alpha-glucosaminide N-acetyltransferase [Pseudomonadota bacterium]